MHVLNINISILIRLVKLLNLVNRNVNCIRNMTTCKLVNFTNVDNDRILLLSSDGEQLLSSNVGVGLDTHSQER